MAATTVCTSPAQDPVIKTPARIGWGGGHGVLTLAEKLWTISVNKRRHCKFTLEMWALSWYSRSNRCTHIHAAMGSTMWTQV